MEPAHKNNSYFDIIDEMFKYTRPVKEVAKDTAQRKEVI